MPNTYWSVGFFFWIKGTMSRVKGKMSRVKGKRLRVKGEVSWVNKKNAEDKKACRV